jgi:hypothetical protein
MKISANPLQSHDGIGQMTDNFPNVSYLGQSALTSGPWTMAGTEARCLIKNSTSLLMGLDSCKAPGGNTSGAQILAQYSSPNGPWQIESQLPLTQIAISSMLVASFPNTNGGVYLTCAGTRNTNGNASVVARNASTRSWTQTFIWNNNTGADAQVRSLFSYTDSVTGIDYLFAGCDDTSGAGGIYTATYNSIVPGMLVWNPAPELSLSSTNLPGQYQNAWNGTGFGVTTPSNLSPKVTSFATDGSGNLCASIGGQIWQRQNGTSPTWNLVWTCPNLGSSSQYGLRGLTQSGVNFLVSLEGSNWGITRLNSTKWAAPNYGSPVVEYNISNLNAALGTGWGASYVIGPYNNMTPISYNGTWYNLMGLSIQVSQYPTGAEIYSPPGSGMYWTGNAHYLVRNGTGRAYTLQEIQQISGGYNMVSARGIATYTVGTTQYVTIAGFDCQGFTAPGYSAWAVYDTAANAI